MRYSVCIACFNGAKYINEQILSIRDAFAFAQIDDYEILISDDGSSDKTVSCVVSLAMSNITLIEGPRGGLIRNFENALKRAQGDFIFLSDQDDVWKVSKVKRCVEELERADLVVSDVTVVGSDLTIISDSFFEHNGSRPGVVRNIIHNSFLGCAMAFNRQILNVCLPFPKRVPMHDWWIGLVANSLYKVKFISEPLLFYRRHGENATHTTEASTNPFFKKVYWRLALSLYLLVRALKIFMFRSLEKSRSIICHIALVLRHPH